MASSHEDDTSTTPEGIFSLLDTDLYKLTMQCAVLKYFPEIHVGYGFTNRTPHMKLTRGAYAWLRHQIHRLGNLPVTDEELQWLKAKCPYLSKEYLDYLARFRLRPDEHVQLSFTPTGDGDDDDDSVPGDIGLTVRGLWLETILYEIPLLALVSEAYFKFVDRDWSHEGQVQKARDKASRLLEHGCMFSEFGSRRRRDYRTHEMVVQGLLDAQQESSGKGWKGKLTGTSNVHLAMRFGIEPVGTVAHEWFMAIAAIDDDYANANEKAMRYWIGTFGPGVLAIALTDTFGTSSFLDAFARPAPRSQTTTTAADEVGVDNEVTYAHVFTGVRQDSGDPMEYLTLLERFYAAQGITQKKVIVFSDSLNVEKCLAYKAATEAAGLTPSFGIGTFFTNDFGLLSKPGEKSLPMNIVIKLSEASGRSAIKLSDASGKNTGDGTLVNKVKDIVGYTEKPWDEGDEAHRWDR